MSSTKNKPGNFWQDHSDRFLEMAFTRDKMERLENPDGYGKRTGTCGDTIEFFLVITGNHIQKARFNINGCLNTSACANTVAFMAEGKTPEEAWKISAEQISDYLQTLPSDHAHCAELAAGAFYLALADYQRKQAETPAGGISGESPLNRVRTEKQP